MALELFVDYISETISLKVKNKQQRALRNFDCSFAASLNIASVPTSSLIANNSKVYSNFSTDLKILNSHYFDGYNQNNFLGYPFVTNIVSLNVKPYSNNVYASYMYVNDSAFLMIDTLKPTSIYIDNNAKKYKESSNNLFVFNAEDILDINYNKNTNFIYPIETSEPSSNTGGENGSNQNTLKEFWA